MAEARWMARAGSLRSASGRVLAGGALVALVACGGTQATSSGTSSGSGGSTHTTATGGLGGGGTTSTGVTLGSGGSDGGANPCTTLIDFETIPGGAPQDGLAINTQYAATLGVSFGLDKDGDGNPDPGVSPVLAKVGDPATAFVYDKTGQGDTAAPGQNIGMFFLTDDGVIAGPPAPLIITYATPVAEAYGQIIDIDGQEGWTIDSRDASGGTIDKLVFNAGDTGTGDGIATPFSFKHAAADIHSIRLRYTGAATGSVGLAFDNFSPACAAPTLQ